MYLNTQNVWIVFKAPLHSCTKILFIVFNFRHFATRLNSWELFSYKSSRITDLSIPKICSMYRHTSCTFYYLRCGCQSLNLVKNGYVLALTSWHAYTIFGRQCLVQFDRGDMLVYKFNRLEHVLVFIKSRWNYLIARNMVTSYF